MGGTAGNDSPATAYVILVSDYTRQPLNQLHLKIARKYCGRCHKKTKFERNATEFSCLDKLFVLFTLGLWLIPKALFEPIANPWRCADCGSTPGRKLLG